MTRAACLNCGAPLPPRWLYSECQKCREGRFPRISGAGDSKARADIYDEAYQRGAGAQRGFVARAEAAHQRQKELTRLWHAKYEQVARENNALRRRWVKRREKEEAEP